MECLPGWSLLIAHSWCRSTCSSVLCPPINWKLGSRGLTSRFRPWTRRLYVVLCPLITYMPISLLLLFIFYFGCSRSSLWHTGLVVAGCGPSFFLICGIFVSRLEIEPSCPALKGEFLSAGLPGKPFPCF